MPSPTSKSRQALKSRFVRGAIPTETDFSDLIGAGLNQAEDGLYKLPNEPLSLVRQKPDQPALRFYEDPAADGSAWQITLADQGVAGFGIANGEGKTSLFIDKATGNLGIGTNEPKQALHVNGTAAIKTLHADEIWVSGQQLKLDKPLGDKLTVLDNGNVGIGTSTPKERLSVQGSVGISGNLTRAVWAITGDGSGQHDETNDGQIRSRTLKINKQNTATALRIIYTDTLSVWPYPNKDYQFGEWEIRIDGKSLQPSMKALLGASLQMVNSGSGKSIFWVPASIKAFALDVPQGPHEIQVWVRSRTSNRYWAPGDDGTWVVDSCTGWHSTNWSIEAEEVWMATL